MILLHLVLSSVSFSVAPITFKSSFTTSIYLLRGLPLLLFPGKSMPITHFPTYSTFLHRTCPYHLSLVSLTFFPICTTFAVPLTCMFLILSSLITPIANLSILNSATSSSTFCLLVSTTVSMPYNMAGHAVLLLVECLCRPIFNGHKNGV